MHWAGGLQKKSGPEFSSNRAVPLSPFLRSVYLFNDAGRGSGGSRRFAGRRRKRRHPRSEIAGRSGRWWIHSKTGVAAGEGLHPSNSRAELGGAGGPPG